MKTYIRQTIYNKRNKKALGFVEILADVQDANKDANARETSSFCRNHTAEFVAKHIGVAPQDLFVPSKLVGIDETYYNQVNDGIENTPLEEGERFVVINTQSGAPMSSVHYIMTMMLSPGDSLREELTVVSIRDKDTGKMDDLFCPLIE